jgi:methyl-accepting chemotaxis protein
LLKELAQEVRKNATDVIEAVRKASEEFSNVRNQTNDALKQITILQVI